MGAEWILYVLFGISVFSIGIILERFVFLRTVEKGIENFRLKVRQNVSEGRWDAVKSLAEERVLAIQKRKGSVEADTDSQIILNLLAPFQTSAHFRRTTSENVSTAPLDQLASDSLLRSKVALEKNLPFLATIGSNAVFVGLFGTVLGIIKAFHDLSQSGSGAQAVMSGISEALVATAVGLMVAIPAVVAFNLFQKQVRKKLTEGEALKSFLIGSLVNSPSVNLGTNANSFENGKKTNAPISVTLNPSTQ